MMVEIINAKCPNCGAILELPEKLDRAFCIHCGGKVIIAQDSIVVHQGQTAIACPECNGRGYNECLDRPVPPNIVKHGRKKYSLRVFYHILTS